VTTELLRLLDEGEDQVLGADVVVAKGAGVFPRRVERAGGQSGQTEGSLTRRRIGQRRETLLGGLLAGAERAADLVPARPTRPCRVYEVVEQLITPGP
jgi:hypothetical protein